ncbi:uncharacterized protein SCHCODRAFT_01173551 [Schizophyllum commune H4-8]|nr:uncharacterized protein SCHCODRAFT_01173551 [Schizophyllum commune H4-8]KAI5889052.1 hypothetical protein SCHCODRAFT_01173551 [Schizophyllum commune H4-8]
MHYGFMLYTPERPGITLNVEHCARITFMTVDDFLRQVKQDGYPPLSAEDDAVLRAACEKLESCGARLFPNGAVNPDGTRATEDTSPTNEDVGQMPKVDTATAVEECRHARSMEGSTVLTAVHMVPRPMLPNATLRSFLALT